MEHIINIIINYYTIFLVISVTLKSDKNKINIEKKHQEF